MIFANGCAINWQGDYLREETAGCGVLLLVAQNIGQKKYWIVNGKIVVLTELADALKNYWQGISEQYPGVLAIDVIVIDLAERGGESVIPEPTVL